MNRWFYGYFSYFFAFSRPLAEGNG